MGEAQTQRRLTSTKALLVAAIVLLAGIGLMLVSELLVPDSKLWLSHALSSLGAVACTSVIVGVLWELVLKREAMSEMYATVALSQRVREVGMVNVSLDFSDAIHWRSHVQGANEIDLFYAYSDRWRSNNYQALQAAAGNGARIRLILPDFRDDQVLSELAARYVRSEETVDEATTRIRNAIRENIREYVKLFMNNAGKPQLTLWLLSSMPMVTFYRMGDIAVIASYNQTGERNKIPVLVGRKGGQLYDFVESEFKTLTDATYEKSQEIVDIVGLLDFENTTGEDPAVEGDLHEPPRGENV